jgi:uncharacterized coiled-coil protein SlyX
MEMGEKIAWGSDTSLMREAADRIEELEAKLATCENCRDDYADRLQAAEGHIEKLEAKLAKAVEALEATLDCIGALSKPHELYGHGLQEDEIKGIFDTLAELKGEDRG